MCTTELGPIEPNNAANSALRRQIQVAVAIQYERVYQLAPEHHSPPASVI